MRQTVYVWRRRAELTREEAHRYWRERHGPLVASVAETLGIKRYVQVHTPLDRTTSGGDPVRGEMVEPYDGVAELWTDPDAATGTEEERAAARRLLAEDEAHFIDFARSSVWVGDEVPMVGEATVI